MSTKAYRLFTVAALSTGLAVLPLTGCSDDSTTGPDGGESGQMTAQMQDSPSGSGSRVALTSGSMSGSMSADAKVQVSADGNTWVDLGSPKSVNMELQSSGSATTVHSNATVNTGTYAHVRLVLENASATVNSGSTIGTTVLDASVNLSIGGSSGRVVIEKQIDPVTVSAEGRSTLVFEMNSEAWITEDNVSARAVSESEIRSATVVSVQ